MKKRMRTAWYGFKMALMLLPLAACAGVDDDTNEPESADIPEAQQEAKLVASLDTESGTRVDFYDFESTGVVVETGPVAAKPMLGQMPGGQDELPSLWRRLAPARSVPSSLHALQERLNKLPRGGRLNREMRATATPIGFEPSEAVRRESSQKATCNNGCCNFVWLWETFWECRGGSVGGQDFLQTRIDTQGSVINPPRMVYSYGSLVCPSRGSAKWILTWGRTNIRLGVPEAHFAHFGETTIEAHWLSSAIRGVDEGRSSHCVTAMFD